MVTEMTVTTGEDLVVLVDEAGRQVGTAAKSAGPDKPPANSCRPPFSLHRLSEPESQSVTRRSPLFTW